MNVVRNSREYWLPIAQRLFIGENLRTTLPHDRGSRTSLIVRNESDRWSAWCFRSGQGDVVFKDHIIKTAAPKTSANRDNPKDAKPVADYPLDVQEKVYGYLLSKGVSPNMLPEILFSEERQRIIFLTDCQKMLGRDITDTHSAKWLEYGYPKKSYLGFVLPKTEAILVEDTLSYYKLRYALDAKDYSPIALLGTVVHPDLAHELSFTDTVHIMLDGDNAGRKAIPRIRKALFGVKSFVHIVPEGKDPRALTIKELRSYFYE